MLIESHLWEKGQVCASEFLNAFQSPWCCPTQQLSLSPAVIQFLPAMAEITKTPGVPHPWHWCKIGISY